MDLERVLLFTGGLDSTCAYFLLDRPECLYVELGREIHLFSREQARVKKIAKDLEIPLGIVYSPWYTSLALPDGHIPLRNLHLVTVGALVADHVVLGALKGESSPDKSDAFLKAASGALTEASQGRKIQVEAPLKRWTKTQLVSRLIEEVGFEEASAIIAQTRSCYSTSEDRCGRCMACFRRWVALASNGIYEAHSSPPWDMPLPSWDERLRYLRQAPAREWPGILRNNAEAFFALHFCA